MKTTQLNRMIKTSLSAGIVGMLLVALIGGCSNIDAPTAAKDGSTMHQVPYSSHDGNGNAVVQHVSVGGADICEAVGLPTGCDKNFSLSANVKGDGSVTGGVWQDAWEGSPGVHVSLDCVNVVGNGAVVGGEITNKGPLQGFRALTAVVDNGTSANDNYDQISFVNPPGFLGFRTCDELTPADFFLFDLVNGQVKVR